MSEEKTTLAQVIYSIARLLAHHPRRAAPALAGNPLWLSCHRGGPGPGSGMALHLLHGSLAAAIAFYDPRLGAVVGASHNPQWTVGQVVDVILPAEK